MNFDGLLIRYNGADRQFLFGICFISFGMSKHRALFSVNYYADYIPDFGENIETADRVLIINILFMQFVKTFKRGN